MNQPPLPPDPMSPNGEGDEGANLHQGRPQQLLGGHSTASARQAQAVAATRRPAWRLPDGVAPGTWEYTRQESIAGGYQDFVSQTPLIGLDTELVFQSLPPPSDTGSRVIDLGCGDGRTMRALWDAGYDVLGVDLSQPMLRRVVAGEHGEEFRSRLVRANLVELGCIADSSADHAVCLFSTIGMIRGRNFRRQFLRHVARIVRPGGTFVLHAHNRNSAWRDRPSAVAWCRSTAAAIRDSTQELGDRVYPYRGLADMFLHTFSRREMVQDLKASGWAIREIIPLSVTSDAVLQKPTFLPGLRAGGFVAVAQSLR